MALMARRSHSRTELRRKLGRRGYEDVEVEAAVARLVELGLQDDRAFAEGHVRRRSRSLGPLALAAELAARGIDRRVAGGAVAHLSVDDQLATATGLAERLSGRRAFGSLKELLDTVGSKLLRRGFSMTVARAACEAVWRRTEA